MNIQIFGTKKSSDTRKAERWFKERRIKAQVIDLLDKGISRGELRSAAQACGGLEALLDENARDRDALARVKYIAAAQREDAVRLAEDCLNTIRASRAEARTDEIAGEIAGATAEQRRAFYDQLDAMLRTD